ncbi:MAG: allantoicase [Jiangellaceae bacterium]
MNDFTTLADLASRALGGCVASATDELFAERENLIRPEAASAPGAFGNKGKVYDGWETRRRRSPGHDAAVLRLGAPGIIRGVVVDTAHFRGNYPPQVSVEATSVDGYPSPDELETQIWATIVSRTAALGDTANAYDVTSDRRWTHVRLSIYPDGGVARFRVHGEVVPDPRFLEGTVDVAALENGGTVVDCSDMFYSSPVNLILPGRARSMGEGWENARRRDDGNDHVTFRLAAATEVREIVVDTSYFVGNAPGWVRVSAADLRDDSGGDWSDVVGRVRVQPDTRHRFLVAPGYPVTHVRLDVYPDGGLSRFNVYGEIEVAALADLRRRW